MKISKLAFHLLASAHGCQAFTMTDRQNSFGIRTTVKMSQGHEHADHGSSVALDHEFTMGSAHLFLNTTTTDRGTVLDGIEISEPDVNHVSLLDPSMLEFVPTCDVTNLEMLEDCDIEMTPQEELLEDGTASYPYVDMIRGSAPYIANHRGELAVIHIPGDLLIWDKLTGLMNDIALCWLLGMKIVIVVGCRRQVEDRLKALGMQTTLNGHTRITTKEQMRVIEEEAGFARFEVERKLHRSLRCSQLSAAANGNVVSGNFFSASPLGVVDGVDFEYTGRPKNLNVRRVLDYLRDGEIVLMTSVGISHGGEGLNVNSECLAAFTAASLCANKVIYCANNGMVLRNKDTKTTVQNFRAKDGRNILNHFKVDVRKDYFLSHKNKEDLPEGAAEMLAKIGWSCKAIQDGVERAHIIAPYNGALIEELFTAKQGSGTCISDDAFESVHPDDDSGDYDVSNEFMYILKSESDPDWPLQVPKENLFPWKGKGKGL